MIKKKLFILITALIMVSEISSLEAFHFGMIGAFSMPFYTGSGFEEELQEIGLEASVDKVINNPIWGFSLGPTMEYRFHPAFSLESEFLLSAAGGGYVMVENGLREVHLFSEINLDLPVLIKYSLALKKNRSLYFMAGPQLSIFLLEAEFVQDDHVFNKENNGRDAYYPVGLGILTAFGWQAPLRKMDILMELRYAREFTNSIRDIGNNYQNVISIATGLKFRTGGEDK
ncbi:MULTISPECIES: porin family protein [unclassified Oceanispirochaeta]|uniref:porin family protein n=1 Tax=unclassified Oceanispirochaeta TaxID=2635722 RepID=UPI000E09BA97|nr:MULTISPECIES: porin family protein [unclassified Oceanispirochaeta]MBF9018773.1 PorT family protein [Oceanispirochaeta sp. M2]NPD75242.1 PorT family protein [Oceanispirochaeta sp. M1]RDG28905.1 PorT family protein [Oceanispirochaeta sp. M1]